MRDDLIVALKLALRDPLFLSWIAFVICVVVAFLALG